MKPDRLQTLLAALDMNQSGAAKFLELDGRTVRRWIAGELPIPIGIAMLLELMRAFRVSPAAARVNAGLVPIALDLARPPGRPAADDQRQAKQPKRRKHRDGKSRRQDKAQSRSAARRSPNPRRADHRPNRH